MTKLEKGDLVNSGKAKSLYKTSDPDLYILHYRDDTSAFDGEKKESLEGKGKTNNKFNAFIALGCIIKGETDHYYFISQAITSGLMTLSINSRKPIGFGILTCKNLKHLNFPF